MSGMNGKFSQVVLDQISGQSTAPLAGATSASTPKPTSSAALTTSSTASATKTSASPANTSNAAVHMKGSSWFGIILGAL
ncbi:hypothetical protein C0993_005478, partial [Termitomyces sp. T159_Od127]